MPREASRPAGTSELLCVQIPPNARSALTLRMNRAVDADGATISMIASPSAMTYTERGRPTSAYGVLTTGTLCSAGRASLRMVTSPGTTTLSAATVRGSSKLWDFALFGKVLDLEGASPIN